MRLLLLTSFLFILNSAYSQIERVKEYYSKGKLESKGKYHIVSTNNQETLHTDFKKNRIKIGKWKYYYYNGNLKQIEFYKKSSDSIEIPTGKWEYWNSDGKLVKELTYKNGSLYQGDICKISRNDENIGKIFVRDGKIDTVLVANYERDTLNLIKNGNFELYKGNPELKILSGIDKIEDLIPFWYTPNKTTPDYYNQFRRGSKVPFKLLPNSEMSREYNYTGLILYKENAVYSEYITGELKKPLKFNDNYCIKIYLCPSRNTDFYINKFGVYFSNKPPEFSDSLEKPEFKPQINFNRTLNDRGEWTILCDSYTSSGDEKYITLGRFAGIFDTKVKRTDIAKSESIYNFNTWAYYLIDKVELHENNKGDCACQNEKNKLIKPVTQRMSFDSINLEDSAYLSGGKIYVLENINFDFNSSKLEQSSMSELEKLRKLLQSNNSLHITLIGYTDNVGSEEYNVNLSLLRAKAVYDWLTEHGIASGRINYKGHGENNPIINNSSKENRSINRRVEFHIDKM